MATGAPHARGPAPLATGVPGRPGWTYTVNTVPPLPTDLADGCGSLFGCPADAGPETGQVVGEPWAIGGPGDGTVDEVVYAVRPTPGAGVAVAVGFQDAAGLHRLALVFRPGRESGPSLLHVVGGGRRLVADAPEFLMIGLVEEDPVTDVAWRTSGGDWRRAPLNDDLVDGYGVFWLVGSWNADWPTDDPAPVTIRVDGREYVR